MFDHRHALYLFFLNMYIYEKRGVSDMGAVAQMPTNTSVQLVWDFKCLVIRFVYGSLGHLVKWK